MSARAASLDRERQLMVVHEANRKDFLALMKSFFYVLIGILLISQCKEKDKYVHMPIHQQAGSPGVLIKQHEYLLAKAKSLSANKDSIALKLYEVLEYHFSEEEQYVFPVLGILPVLAAGNMPEESDAIIGLTVRFKSNSAKLLAEHQVIRTLIEEYKLRFKTQNDIGFNEFEQELTEHANAEEEIYFPATVVIGDYLKLKSATVKQ